jgi:hypothetical protein
MIVRHNWKINKRLGDTVHATCKVCQCRKETWRKAHVYFLPDGRSVSRLPKCGEFVLPKKVDYTQSATTVGGQAVKGLFKDGPFIRGYVKNFGWTAYTWYASNGAHVLNDKDKTLKPRHGRVK